MISNLHRLDCIRRVLLGLNGRQRRAHCGGFTGKSRPIHLSLTTFAGGRRKEMKKSMWANEQQRRQKGKRKKQCKMRKGDKRTGLEIRRSIYLVGIFGFSPVIVVSAYRMGESAWVDLAQVNTYPGIYANRRCYHVLFSICSQFSRLIFLRLRVFERYVIDSARLSSGTLARCFWSESPRFSVHILCVRYYPRLLSNSRLIYW